MRSSRTRKEITDVYGRYIQRISLRQLWQRLYLKIKIMNLNITPTDKISEELAAIDAFLNITMSEEVQEAVLRGNDLAVYIARTGKLLADAKYHLNGKKKSEVFDTLRETASRAGATSKAVNAIIEEKKHISNAVLGAEDNIQTNIVDMMARIFDETEEEE